MSARSGPIGVVRGSKKREMFELRGDPPRKRPLNRPNLSTYAIATAGPWAYSPIATH